MSTYFRSFIPIQIANNDRIRANIVNHRKREISAESFPDFC